MMPYFSVNRCLPENNDEICKGEIRSLISIYYKAKQAQQVSPNTMRIIRQVMEDFCMWFLDSGRRWIDEMTVPVLQEYFLEKEQYCAPNTVHIYYRNLRTFSYHLEDLTEGKLRSPFHNKALKPPKVPKEKKCSVGVEEVMAFVKAIKGDYVLRNKAFFLTAFDSGLRLAEVCALRIQDIDLITGRIEVLHGKGGKYRVSFVSAVTLKALRKYLISRPHSRPTEPLFLSDSGTFLSEQGMQAVRYKIEKQCGIKLGGFHALRRGFAKEFLKNGGDLVTLQNLLGHSEIETTRGYVQLDPNEMQEIYTRNSPLDRAAADVRKRRTA